jgi:LysR family transcriptional regulator, glycine cleavage system transcriptional activator
MPSELGSRQNWESLRIFSACAEHLSFTRAADELGLTQAAVSQRISQLERRLGVRLFVRRPRLKLTDDGARLAPRVALGFSSIERALQEIRTPRLLSVTTTVTFATLWLLPRLPQFRRYDPEISLALDIADEFQSLDDGRFDVAVRCNDGPTPGLRSELIFPLEITPYVSRQLVREGRPLTVEALARLPLIPEQAWTRWFQAVGARPPPARTRRGQLLVRYQHLILEAVLAGEGVGLLTPALVQTHVESGRLLRPFRQTITDGGYYLHWRADREDDPLIATFRRWIAETIAAESADAVPLARAGSGT